MIIESVKLGQLSVDDDQIISFPKGLPGFPNEKSFALVPYSPDSPFCFLQSTIERNLTFLVVDPFSFFTDYEFHLDDQATEELKLSSEYPPQILNVVTVPEKVEEMTANLLAPIIINPQKHIAQQIVLEKVAYITKHRLFKEAASQAGTKGGK